MKTKIKDVIDCKQPYIIVDFEANGDLHNPFLLQVGAVKVVNNEIVDKFNQWCYYDGEISKFISLLLNKDKSFYLSQKSEYIVWSEFLGFCDGVNQVINFGKYYDDLIIQKVHERTNLNKINLIDIQGLYFNKMCGVLKQGQAAVSLDVVNRIFYKNNDFDHLEHDAYEDCILLFNTIKSCLAEEESDFNVLLKKFKNAYLLPRPKNFRGVSKRTKELEIINLKPKSPIIFIEHYVEHLNDQNICYHNRLYSITNKNIKHIKTFSLMSTIDNNHDFYSNFKEVETYIYDVLGLDANIFVSNVDFLIKKIQTSYCSKTKIYPLIYWIPYEWIKVRLKFEDNKINDNQKQELFDLLQDIYYHYWK